MKTQGSQVHPLARERSHLLALSEDHCWAQVINFSTEPASAGSRPHLAWRGWSQASHYFR